MEEFEHFVIIGLFSADVPVNHGNQGVHRSHSQPGKAVLIKLVVAARKSRVAGDFRPVVNAPHGRREFHLGFDAEDLAIEVVDESRDLRALPVSAFEFRGIARSLEARLADGVVGGSFRRIADAVQMQAVNAVARHHVHEDLADVGLHFGVAGVEIVVFLEIVFPIFGFAEPILMFVENMIGIVRGGFLVPAGERIHVGMEFKTVLVGLLDGVSEGVESWIASADEFASTAQTGWDRVFRTGRALGTSRR